MYIHTYIRVPYYTTAYMFRLEGPTEVIRA